MFFFTSTLCAMVPDTRCLAGAFLCISFLNFSCTREIPFPAEEALQGAPPRIPLTGEERRQVERIREVARVLEKIYEDPEVVEEVNAAIASGFYEDERVLLKDMLDPAGSPLYAYARGRRTEGLAALDRELFARRFLEEAGQLLESGQGGGALREESYSPVPERAPAGENALRDYFSATDISIYFPYSEDFSATERPLAIPALVEGDWMEVPDPECAASPGVHCPPVRIDEDYVMKRPVHMVTLGAEPSAGLSSKRNAEALVQGNPTLVYLGRVKCTEQYDALISFKGNGGGSELRFIRGEAYITLSNNQQVVETEFDIIPVNFSRKDIRKGREKEVFAIWDPNWEEDMPEQVFGIYEEDTQGEREFSGSVRTVVKHPGGESTVTPVSYAFSVSTQDAIIRQINWERGSFFRYNRSGLAGCGLKDGYTWYDCRLAVSYSLPEY